MTIQAPDYIIYKGEKRFISPPSLLDCPLLSDGLILSSFYKKSTGLRRGYIATWTIDGDSLRLVQVDGFPIKTPPDGSIWIQPKSLQDISANWINETIEIPDGEMLEAGYEFQMPERSICLSIEHGQVVQTEHRNNRETAQAQAKEDAESRARLKARIAAKKREAPIPTIDLPPESPMESRAWAFLEAAMMGEVESSTRLQWREFYCSAKAMATATEYERELLETVNNAYGGLD